MEEDDIQEAIQLDESEQHVIPVAIKAETIDPEQNEMQEDLHIFRVQSQHTSDVSIITQDQALSISKDEDKPTIKCRSVAFFISICVLGLWIYFSIDLDNLINETENDDLCRYPGLKIMNKIVLAFFTLAAVVSLSIFFSMMLQCAGFEERNIESYPFRKPTIFICRSMLFLIIVIFVFVLYVINTVEDCDELDEEGDEEPRYISGTLVAVCCVSGFCGYSAFHVLCCDHYPLKKETTSS